MNAIKVITLIQPWATLIAMGEKKFETRSWATKHRGDLAIHAGKKIDKAVCRQEPFRSVLAKYGYTADNLPAGVILAQGRLSDCYQVVMDTGTEAILSASGDRIVAGNEYKFGNYGEGRFAWLLTGVEPLKKPIQAKGRLGLWNCSLLDHE